MTFALVPKAASADWLFTPFIGFNFGGDADFGEFDDFDDEFERRLNTGASLAWMGAGVAGFEIDFGWSPNFFEDTVGPGDFEFGDSHVTTLMFDFLLGIPIGGQSGGGIRPYVAGGGGLMQTAISGDEFFDDFDTNDFGVNVGGGLHGFFGDAVGLRGDVRYFRSLRDDEPDDEVDISLSDFNFWRATLGVTFRFGSD
jgi:hypothetical protein